MNQSTLIRLKILVERAVRPVRTSLSRKRKMREELLAHSTAVYEAERDGQDEQTALKATIRRFGDPAQLVSELQDAVPRHEGLYYWLDRQLGWRAPESAAKYLQRLALRLFLVTAIVFCLIALGIFLFVGGDGSVWVEMRPAAAFLLLVCIGQFILGLLYFKIRDALCGGVATRKSLFRVTWLGTLFGVVTLGSGLGFIGIAAWDPAAALDLLWPCVAAALACPIGIALYARAHGPSEIGDTEWACLDAAGSTFECPENQGGRDATF